MQHFFAGSASLAEIRVHTRFGPRPAPGRIGHQSPERPLEMEMMRLGEGLGSISRRTDVLILDAAAGISPQSVLNLLLPGTC